MTARRLFPSGAVEVCDMVDGYLVTRTYYGYTIHESRRMFREEMRSHSKRRK